MGHIFLTIYSLLQIINTQGNKIVFIRQVKVSKRLQKNKILFSFPVEYGKLPCIINEKKWQNNSQNKDKIIDKPCGHEELGKTKICEPLSWKITSMVLT